MILVYKEINSWNNSPVCPYLTCKMLMEAPSNGGSGKNSFSGKQIFLRAECFDYFQMVTSPLRLAEA